MGNMTPYVLMIGLGAHSLFEGIAVGMGHTVNEVALLVLAIVMHKGAAGMSLGTSMAKAFPDRDNHVVLLLFFFSIFTPLGVLIGWAVGDDSPLTEMVFTCLAAGTFLYIACSEVIIEEFSSPKNKWIKLVFYLIGMGIIASIKFIEPADS